MARPMYVQNIEIYLARDLERCRAWRKHEGEVVIKFAVVRINQGLGARPM